MTWRIGIDTGGTFTDVIARDEEGAVRAAKIWSRRDDPVGTIVAAVEALGLSPKEVRGIVYGTTIVTNALVEGNLAPTALVTTRGFADVLDIARQNRRVIYDFAARPRPAPIVPPERRVEANERLAADGSVEIALDAAEVARIAAAVPDAAETVAVCFLHAYANGEHERAVRAALESRFEHVVISSDVSPEAREYERTLTTCLSAAVLPRVAQFADDLTAALPASVTVDLFQSIGGMVPPAAAVRAPLVLAESGPAAGVEAACRVARGLDIDRAISIDMGGTTTDVCLIVDGRPEITDNVHVGDWLVRQPTVAVHSIGAGGGSIVRLEGEALTVGPDSAGSTPGPASYGRGGTLPTLTDAAVVLGFLEGTADITSELHVDPALAARALEPVRKALGVDVHDLALGVQRVTNAIATRALRSITVERGVDLRRCTLIAFGGAGPMFAGELARAVGIRRVVVPASSSGLSALGCLVAEPRFAIQRTLRVFSSAWDDARLAAACDAMEAETAAQLRRGGAGEVTFRHTALVKYAGQSHPIEVPFARGADRARPVDPARLGEDFRTRHHAVYGYATDEDWELDALRVAAIGPRAVAAVDAAAVATGAAGPVRTVEAWFAGTGATPTPIRRRGDVTAPLAGPAILIDDFSTVVVPPGCSVAPAGDGHLDMTIGD